MKVVAFALVALMTSLCLELAAPRRALVSSRRADDVTKNDHVYGTTENHHNIPRQYYNQWGSGGDNNGDNNPTKVAESSYSSFMHQLLV